MRIRFRVRAEARVDELKRRAVRSLHLSLGRFLTALAEVSVVVDQVRDSRSGLDVRCSLRATLAGGQEVRAEVRDRDPILAIDRAANRLGRDLARRRALSRARIGGPLRD